MTEVPASRRRADPVDRGLVALRVVGTAVLVLAAADLLVLDPLETLTPDLPRLYREAGGLAVGWVLSAAVWLAGSCWVLWRTTSALRDERRRSGLAVSTCLAAWAGLLGGLLLVHVVLVVGTGIGMYGVAQTGGFAPPGASAGRVTELLLVTTALLLVLAAVLAAGRRLRRRR